MVNGNAVATVFGPLLNLKSFPGTHTLSLLLIVTVNLHIFFYLICSVPLKLRPDGAIEIQLLLLLLFCCMFGFLTV